MLFHMLLPCFVASHHSFHHSCIDDNDNINSWLSPFQLSDGVEHEKPGVTDGCRVLLRMIARAAGAIDEGGNILSDHEL